MSLVWRDKRFEIHVLGPIHLLRHYAFERNTGFDEEIGIDPSGYNTLEEAIRALNRIEGR